MNKHSKTEASSSAPTEPVSTYDEKTGELRIYVPFVPAILSVTLWGSLGGTPTRPPKQQSSDDGVPVKPPKKIEVQTEESDNGEWPDPQPRS